MSGDVTGPPLGADELTLTVEDLVQEDALEAMWQLGGWKSRTWVEELVAPAAVAVTPPLPKLGGKLIMFDDMISAPIAPPTWVIEPFIAEGDSVILAGEWGSLKTFTLMHWMLAIASGINPLGPFTIPEGRRVLYVDEEMGERKCRARLQRLALGMGLSKGVPAGLLVKSGIKFTPSSMRVLLEYAAQAGLSAGDVVIFDSFRKGLVGSENEQQDVGLFWDATEYLRRAGLSLILPHHMRKPRSKHESTRHRASGNTSIQAGADSVIAVERPSAKLPQINVIQDKNREADEFSPFGMTFTFDGTTGPITVAYGPAVSRKGPASEPSYRVQILSYLRAHPGLQPTKVIADGTGLEEGSGFYKALKELKEAGLTESPAKGAWMAISEKVSPAAPAAA
jgi:hypothetical protein